MNRPDCLSGNPSISGSTVNNSHPIFLGSVRRLPPESIVPHCSQYKSSKTRCLVVSESQRILVFANSLPTVLPSSPEQPQPECVHPHKPSIFLKNQCKRNAGSSDCAPWESQSARAINIPRAAATRSAAATSGPNNLCANSEYATARTSPVFEQA